MIRLFLPLVLVSAALTTPTLALETIKCADAKGEVELEYDIEVLDPAPISRVQMQIIEDFGISTDPAHEDHSGEKIAEQYFSNDFVGVILRTDASGLPALKLRLGYAGEGDAGILAGALAVSGGGVWAVTCK